MTQVLSDFQAALTKANLGAFFANCTPAHQREYLKWIDEAKRPETRKARIAQAVTMITEKCAKEKARSKK